MSQEGGRRGGLQRPCPGAWERNLGSRAQGNPEQGSCQDLTWRLDKTWFEKAAILLPEQAKPATPGPEGRAALLSLQATGASPQPQPPAPPAAHTEAAPARPPWPALCDSPISALGIAPTWHLLPDFKPVLLPIFGNCLEQLLQGETRRQTMPLRAGSRPLYPRVGPRQGTGPSSPAGVPANAPRPPLVPRAPSSGRGPSFWSSGR